MRPLRDDLSNILSVDLFFEHARSLNADELRLHVLNALFQFRNGGMAQFCHFAIVIFALGFLKINLRLLKFLF